VRLDFETGQFRGCLPTSERTVSDLAPIWRQAPKEDDERVVYRTYGMPGHDREDPELLYASTVIEPGRVEDEFFMTRGHFHIKPERGEWILTLRGEGALVLRDRAGNAWTEALAPGRVQLIPGHLAHRVVNTGSEPLAFVVTWLADCGHDYETIAREGFGLRLLA
jgi:glucose-6-phosphate isomerase, archaeal